MNDSDCGMNHVTMTRKNNLNENYDNRSMFDSCILYAMLFINIQLK